MNVVIRENVSLRPYTTLKTGGVAHYLAEVSTTAELQEVINFAKGASLPMLVLGSGSNVLLSDEGFAGVVILNRLLGLVYEEGESGVVTLKCAGGELLDDVVLDTVNRGYFGLENLSAIPGTVGATPVQNVGAYGVEVGGIITHVDTINLETNTTKIFSNEECNFGYRDSFFKTNEGKKYFITTVYLKLKKQSAPQIAYSDLKKYFNDTTPSVKEVREAIINIRSEKFPDWKVVGTAGSFFKNPLVSKEQALRLKAEYPELPLYESGSHMFKIPLGYVLDKVCGLKGYRLNNVGLFPAQALVLINYGGATAEEIKNFASHVAKIVLTKTQIVITPEVSFIEKN